jgi:hypothetical protein
MNDGLVLGRFVDARVPAVGLQAPRVVDRQARVIADARTACACGCARPARVGIVDAVTDVFVKERSPLTAQIDLRRGTAAGPEPDDEERQRDAAGAAARNPYIGLPT